MLLILTSSIGWPAMPAIMEQISEDPLEETMLEMFTRLMLPTGTPAGPRIRAPRRRKIGDATVPLMVTFEMVMFLNPPFDPVPSLMRPLRSTSEDDGNRWNEASSTAPSM